ncbi:MAG: ATP-binding protein [Proteobacteria bacterium]|nr:ATP-binding protein [Pseudomonadota bacterium]
MPHRLRKVFGINIRNATTNAASAQIALLDLRAHTMAIGENGVGKSSFVRLIPLFYGATPEKIMRHTQKQHLIGYTLPAPSSAVAFEYERETENDLRLAVMFAKPGLERPEFMIIEGGYNEAYFVNENGEFVDRDRFKDHVERMGKVVSPRWELHEYRSVILYEHRHTKEARGLRHYAAQHSLGPSSLYGLDLIAVAMTSEKLSFRELQNLVLDRLNDSAFEGSRNSNARQLRKDRKDVDAWLASVKHAQDVIKDSVRKKTIEDQIGRVGEIALDLGSLRAACEVSIDRRVEELDQHNVNLGRLTIQLHDHQRESTEGAAAHDRAVSQSSDAHSAAKTAAEEILGQERHYAAIGIKNLVQEAALQGQYTHEKQAASSEHSSLTAQAENAQQALQATLSNLEKDLQERKTQLQSQRESATQECEAQEAAVEQERAGVIAELETTPAAPRLAEIEAKVAEHQNEIGVQDTLSRMAEAPKEAQENLAKADVAFKEAEATLAERTRHVERAELSEKSNAALQVQTLQNLNQADAQLTDATSRHETLKAQLNPPAGSVLATLRAQPADQWASTAKVLDPEHLLRTDLAPHFQEDLLRAPSPTAGEGRGGGDETEEVTVGPLLMNVAPIELPRWATQDGARARISESSAQLEEFRAQHSTALAAAKKAQADLDADRKALQTGQHDLGRARKNLTDAADALVRARRHIDVEKERVRKGHAEEAARLRRAVTELTHEFGILMRDEQARRSSVLRQFDDRTSKLRGERDAMLLRLKGESSAAETGAKEQRERAIEAHSRALEGLGVDPAKVKALTDRIERLDAKLVTIAQNAHYVTAWRKFEMEMLPLKREREAREQELRQRADAAVKDREKFNKDAQEQHAKLLKAESNARSLVTSTEEELGHLRRLLSQQLVAYRNQGAVYVGEGLYGDLQASTSTRLDMLGSATQKLEAATRDLCTKMRERSGPISQWLDNTQAAHNALIHQREEQGVGDHYLQHERAVDWARAVCEWFAPLTHREYHLALRHEMDGLFASAESFVNHIANFESRVDELNRQFNKSLDQASGFKRFNNLHINISSTATSSPALKALREMRDVNQSRLSSHRTALAANPQLPSDEEIALVRSFRDQIPDTGSLQVNLDEHVRLTFELTEMGKSVKIDNDRSMAAFSSNGLTVVINMMFILGFLGIVRGPGSPVGMTWVLDEVGRVSPDNMVQYLEKLVQQNVTAVCAAPSIDPALGCLFESTHLFEEDGSIAKSNAPGVQAPVREDEEALQ